MAVCGLSLVVARGLLIAVASPMEHGLWGVWASVFVAPRLQSTDSVVVAHGLSCSAACGILVRGPGIEPMSPALQGGFLTTGPP